ncbi:MAG: hypothetical protein ABR574_07055 [Cryomorphaceae bacterium]
MRVQTFRVLGILFLATLVFSGCRNEDNKIEPTCFDEVKNQGELRVDCGGPNCPECPPACDDGIQNQDEQSPVTLNNPNVLGIDCGGENCEPCSTCDDGIQNAHWVRDLNLTEDSLSLPYVAQNLNGTLYRLVMETDIDCGFPCEQVCEPNCDDGILNGNEVNIDCGGDCPDDCPPTCDDGIQNGDETGIDCGSLSDPDGLVCPECPDPTCNDGIQNIHIEVNEDFPNGYIVVVETGIDCDDNPLTSCPDCPAPTCYDGVQNGTETGVDCGGNCITTCSPNETCNDGVMNGDEAGIDCDFDDSTPCPPCAQCGPEGSEIDGVKNGPEFDVDCVDYPIPEYPCPVCPSCHDEDLTEELYELDVDCGGDCDDCDMELVAEAIGGNNGSPFRDQYSFNRILAQNGNTDTLELDHNLYPGLKIEKLPGGAGGVTPDLVRVEANQGFMTNNGLLIKTVVLQMPYPETYFDEGAGEGTVPLANLAQPTLAGCSPFQFGDDDIPFIEYSETLVENQNLLNKCFLSYVEPGETSELTVDYLVGYDVGPSEYYAKGEIDQGWLRTAPDAISGDTSEGIFENVGFKIQYDYFPQ